MLATWLNHVQTTPTTAVNYNPYVILLVHANYLFSLTVIPSASCYCEDVALRYAGVSRGTPTRKCYLNILFCTHTLSDQQAL